ncbi:hypothetical protein MNV49_007422 [Pseudohyphozyma bogoriensis]|nr:hypothetical protein MNV49_007422 [Pseudohyphozyma bogoriensis]
MSGLNVFQNTPVLDTLSQPFSSLSQLVQAEEEDSKRIRLSKLGWWVDVRRVKGSTLPRIWRAVVWITLWSAAVAAAEFSYGKQLGLTNNVTPLLSVVVGLLLVFRNGTAFGRWDDGRKLFGSMTSNVRSLSRSVWINVGAFPPMTGRLASDNTLKPTNEPTITDEDAKAKITAVRMMVAFVVATKHHVRREYGTDYEDLKAVLPEKFYKLAKTNGYGYGSAEADAANEANSFAEPRMAEYARLSRQRSQSPSPSPLAASPTSAHFYNTTTNGAERAERSPLLRHQSRRSQTSTDSAVILSNHLAKPSLPLPLIIAHQLGLYLALCKRKGLLESVGPAGLNAMQQSVSSLVSDFTSIERLAQVGIPAVYGIHLKQCVTLFLCSLPFTLVELMGWKMVPFVTLCAFTLIGIEGIASEIEQPFGLDPSDLPLDLMCAELRNEVEHTISRLDWHTESWMA